MSLQKKHRKRKEKKEAMLAEGGRSNSPLKGSIRGEGQKGTFTAMKGSGLWKKGTQTARVTGKAERSSTVRKVSTPAKRKKRNWRHRKEPFRNCGGGGSLFRRHTEKAFVHKIGGRENSTENNTESPIKRVDERRGVCKVEGPSGRMPSQPIVR